MSSVDETISFPEGNQNQDILVYYVTDSANVVIGRYAQGFVTNQMFAGEAFISVNQRPTVTGNFNVYLVDETDRTYDRALGSSFGGVAMASTSFNAVNLDADCVPEGDTTAPRVQSILRQTPATQVTGADSLVFRVTFDEAVQNVDTLDFVASASTATATGVSSVSSAIYDVTVSGGDLASYNGTVGLGFAGGQNIADLASNALANTTPTGSNQTYSVTNPADIAVSSASGPVSGTQDDDQGSLPAGDAQTVTYTISNTGVQTLNIGQPASSAAANVTVGSVGAPGSTAIAPGGTTTFTVQFTPVNAGAFSFRLSISSNDPDENPYVFDVVGTATGDPDMTVSSSESGATVASGGVDNHGEELSGVGKTVTYTIKNDGLASLTLQTLAASAPVNVVVNTISSPQTTLAPGASTTLNLNYTPFVNGAYSFQFAIGNNDPDENPYYFTVSGTAGSPEIDILGNGTSIVSGDTTPSVADDTDFGNVNVASGSTANTFAIRNNGDRTLNLTSVTSSDAAVFAVSGTTGGAIAAGASATFNVTFDPDAVGQHNATITVVSDDLDEASYTFAVAGTGSDTPTFAQAFAPNAITTGGTSTVTFTIDNSANSVAATGLDFTNTLPSGMVVATPANASTTCTGGTLTAVSGGGALSYTGGMVAAGAVCSISADVTTTSDGAYSNVTGALTSSLGTSGTSGASLASTSPEISVSSSESGTVTDGGTDAQGAQEAGVSNTVTYTVSNTGTADLLIATATSSMVSNVTINSISVPASTTIAPAGSTTFTVNYTPAIAGNFSFVLSFVTTDTDENPFNFTISGGASGAPDIAVSSSESGAVADGGTDTVVSSTFEGTAASVIYTIENTGTDTLTITTPTVAGNTSGASNVTVNSIVLAATTVAPGDSTTLTVGFTPTAGGAFGFNLAIPSDAAGAAASYEITLSGSAVARPTVTLSGAPEGYAGTSGFTVTATFSESVTGFSTTGVTVTNGTVDSVAGGGSVYTISITPNGAGDVSVSIPGNAAFAVSGAGNLPSEVATVVNRSVEETQAMIAEFMASRATLLIGHQPNLRSIVFGKGKTGGFTFSAKNSDIDFRLDSLGAGPVWFSLSGSRAQADGSEGTYVFGTVGSHYWIDENRAVGAMLQFDHLRQEDGAANIEGTGWLVGPYFSARSASQPIYFNAHLLYGRTHNSISPFGTYEDSFDTERFLASAEVAGEFEKGNITYFPALSATWTRDVQEAYVDTPGNTVGSQDLTIGQLAIGLDFQAPIFPDLDGWTLFGGVQGSYNVTGGSNEEAVSEYEGGRGRVELGLLYEGRSGTRAELSGFYDGLGANGYESFGASLSYNFSF